MPPLEQAGWWTLFGSFALASTAGILAGLAERQEDEAVRLATRFDLDQGRQLLYADVEDRYSKILARGRAYDRAAIGLAVVAGAAAIAGGVLLIVDARRNRRSRGGAMARRLGALEVRF